MGKIANALGKYAQERKTERPAQLTREDRVALLSYNPKTGHLVNPEPDAGTPANRSMEALRNRGTLQRLLDHKLIFPGGKLTPKGLAEYERLKKLNHVPKPAINADLKIRQKTPDGIDIDDVIIDLEEEIKPVKASAKVAAPPEKSTPDPKSRPGPQPAVKAPQPAVKAPQPPVK